MTRKLADLLKDWQNLRDKKYKKIPPRCLDTTQQDTADSLTLLSRC
jgi:hypothetical protein